MSSMDMDHLMVNASWLGGEFIGQQQRCVAEQSEGSLLTILFDLFVSETEV